MANGVEYLQYYLFVNGMYPKWLIFVSTIGKSHVRRTLSFGLVKSGGHYVCLHNFHNNMIIEDD